MTAHEAQPLFAIAGQPHDLPAPFHVLATQNPIEQEGTYPLPEAQLDRFLVQIDVPYPDRDTERDILLATTGLSEDESHAVFTAEDLMAAQTITCPTILSGDSGAPAVAPPRRAQPDAASKLALPPAAVVSMHR